MAALTVSVSAATSLRAQGIHSNACLKRRTDCRHGLQLPGRQFRQLSLRNTSGFCPSMREISVGLEGCIVRKTRSYRALSSRASSETETDKKEKIPFGSTRKDVLIVGFGITAFGFALKYGLQAAGLDPLKAGNVVQITLVLGLMLGWLSTYLFRVGGKQMTYVQQLKDYEDAVMKKRLEEMPEAELESMLAEIEEEKRRLKEKRKSS